MSGGTFTNSGTVIFNGTTNITTAAGGTRPVPSMPRPLSTPMSRSTDAAGDFNWDGSGTADTTINGTGSLVDHRRPGRHRQRHLRRRHQSQRWRRPVGQQHGQRLDAGRNAQQERCGHVSSSAATARRHGGGQRRTSVRSTAGRDDTLEHGNVNVTSTIHVGRRLGTRRGDDLRHGHVARWKAPRRSPPTPRLASPRSTGTASAPAPVTQSTAASPSRSTRRRSTTTATWTTRSILAGSGSTLLVNGATQWTMNQAINANNAGVGTATIGGTSRLILTGANADLNVNGNTNITAPLTLWS